MKYRFELVVRRRPFSVRLESDALLRRQIEGESDGVYQARMGVLTSLDGLRMEWNNLIALLASLFGRA